MSNKTHPIESPEHIKGPGYRAPTLLANRVSDLIEQWERREEAAADLLDEFRRLGCSTGLRRIKIKIGVIRSMLAELRREFNQ